MLRTTPHNAGKHTNRLTCTSASQRKQVTPAFNRHELRCSLAQFSSAQEISTQGLTTGVAVQLRKQTQLQNNYGMIRLSTSPSAACRTKRIPARHTDCSRRHSGHCSTPSFATWTPVADILANTHCPSFKAHCSRRHLFPHPLSPTENASAHEGHAAVMMSVTGAKALTARAKS